MLVGKRPRRHPVRRTTSMTEFAFDPSPVVEFAVSPPIPEHPTESDASAASNSPGSSLDTQTRMTRRHSADYGLSTTTTGPFLKFCCLCQVPFIPGHDIYMYRGDSAFCSLECRQQKMAHDDRKERLSKKSPATSVPISVASTGRSKVTAPEGETVTTTAA